MKVLVTGFNGFIGMRLLPYLEAYGRYVWPFFGDVTSSSDWEKNSAVHPDAVIHLAAMTGIAECENDRPLAYKTNVESVIMAQKYTPYSKHILASTVTVIGVGNKDRYFKYNEYWPAHPETAYDSTKAIAEDIMQPNSVVLRMGNVYGVSPSDTGAGRGIVNSFVHNASKGVPNVVYEEVAQCVRDYIYILDVVKAFNLALDYDVVGTYNVCSGAGHTVEEMASMCGKYVVSPANRSLPKIDRRSFVGDNSKLRSFGWEPVVNLENGIELTRRMYQ